MSLVCTCGNKTDGSLNSQGKEEKIIMRRRDCRLTLYLSMAEMEKLKRNARASCMDRNTYLRELIKGHEPRQAPDDRFWKAMELIRELSDKIDEVAMKADNSVDMIAVMTEARKWRAFQNAIEKELLRPKERDVNGGN